MKLSDLALNLTPSEPRRIYDEAQKYTGVIDLTLGDPDHPPPIWGFRMDRPRFFLQWQHPSTAQTFWIWNTPAPANPPQQNTPAPAK